MPARTPLVFALVAAVAFPLTTWAQPALLADRGPIEAAPTSISLSPYAGVYTTAGGFLELVERQGALRMIANGPSVAAALASESDALHAQTETLLDAWIAGDAKPLIASVAPHRQREAEVSFAAFRSALTCRIGDMTDARIVGTFRQTNGRRATLALVQFERGSQWISLVWADSDDLVTVKRGLSPVVAGTARPIGRDLFESNGTRIAFSRDAAGRIHELAVGSRVRATR